MQNGKQDESWLKENTRSYLSVKKKTCYDFSYKSRGHFLVSPFSNRFLIFWLCRSWRTDWNWNSLHWTRVDPLQHTMHLSLRHAFCKATPHKDCFWILEIQCAPTETMILIFMLTYNKCAGAFEGVFKVATEETKGNKACLFFKLPVLEPIHYEYSDSDHVHQMKLSQS